VNDGKYFPVKVVETETKSAQARTPPVETETKPTEARTPPVGGDCVMSNSVIHGNLLQVGASVYTNNVTVHGSADAIALGGNTPQWMKDLAMKEFGIRR